MNAFRNALGCLGLVMLALLSGACEEPPVPVNVPGVVGLGQAAAETAIINAGLTVGAVTSQYHATVPAGDVLSQNPAPDSTVLPGTAVDLVVSDGPEPVSVPDVIGMTQAAAETAITDANLTVGTVTEEYHATVPAGDVINQHPAFGCSVLPNTAVDIVVSEGPKPVGVPNVVGTTQNLAEIVITIVGLTVGTVTEEYHGSVPAGRAIRQDPTAGTDVLPGTAVNFVISKGREPVSVPNVAGLTRAAAETAIIEAGLTIGTVTNAYHTMTARGTVHTQDPAPDVVVFRGTAVDFSVAELYSDGDGSSEAPYLISIAQDLLDLANPDNSGDWNKHFLMTADIDMAGIAGFTTIGDYGVSFTGSFDGGGHAVHNLVIDLPSRDFVGLFGLVKAGAIIQNVGLIGGSVAGRTLVGGLAGCVENGSIDACYTTCDVAGSGEYVGGLIGQGYGTTAVSGSYAAGTVTGLNCVGGLVGRNYGTVTQCHATGAVTGQGTVYTGGLLGDNDGGTVTQCYATGEVTGWGNCTGGLVGSSYMGTVSECYATGTVTGSAFVGGLLGNTSGGTLSGCYTTSRVAGNTYVGGLLGSSNFDAVTQCHATSVVIASGWYAGGFLAYNNHSAITQCYAMSDVTGSAFVGGLVGVNDQAGAVAQCYAGGTVTGVGAVGGLVGYSRSSAVSECYATGMVSGLADVGGLLGFNESGTVAASFWDTEASGRAVSAGGVGKTTADMMTQSTFTDAGWNFIDVWYMLNGGSYPYLLNNPEVE